MLLVRIEGNKGTGIKWVKGNGNEKGPNGSNVYCIDMAKRHGNGLHKIKSLFESSQ